MATRSEEHIEPEPPEKERPSVRYRSASNPTGPLSQKQMIERGDIDEKSYASYIPPELTKIDQNMIHQLYKTLKHLNILITGLTGSGKSALTNAFLGHTEIKERGASDAAEEGHIIKQRCTERVEGKVSRITGRIGVKIWDTPGLQDGSTTKEQKKYLDEIACVRARYNRGDLVIFCIKADTRFVDGEDNMNVRIMIKLTKKFGKDFWANAVIVLTFANALEAINPQWTGLTDREKAEAFREKIQQYDDQIRNNLKKFVKLDQEIVKSMKIVPAGYYAIPKLPDRTFWFSSLWFECLNAIPTVKGKTAFVYSYHGQITDNQDESSDPTRIVLTDNFLPERLLEMKREYQTKGGLLGMLGGPLGVVTIPLGMWAGQVYGEMSYKKEIEAKKHETEN